MLSGWWAAQIITGYGMESILKSLVDGRRR
jgi:hypothetical protein